MYSVFKISFSIGRVDGWTILGAEQQKDRYPGGAGGVQQEEGGQEEGPEPVLRLPT